MSSNDRSNVSVPEDLERRLLQLRQAARAQRQLPTAQKNDALLEIASALGKGTAYLLEANGRDLARLEPDTALAFRDRLTLTAGRIDGLVESLKQVAALPDPVGEAVEERQLKNGLLVRRERAPLGVLFMIFEARPNVIVEAFALAFKSGNVICLRGGSESRESSHALYKLINDALKASGLNHGPMLGLEDYDRKLVTALLSRHDLIDVVIPRGGDRLIEIVRNIATMPIIKNDRGLCHAYVAEDADINMAVTLVQNAKTQRPGVCNSLETLLVHENIAAQFLPPLYTATKSVGLSWRVDERVAKILSGNSDIALATAVDWDTEHLDMILNCRVVKGLEPALEHIAKHGSKHSEMIVTSSKTTAQKFLDEVDAAAVYWNASTRFTDGFELGLGGELGISTQKLHVRGPVGLRELTTPRWIIEGAGQIRK